MEFHQGHAMPSLRLLEEEKEPPPETWELAFMSVVLFFMFVALISDRIAPDHVFVTALAFCVVTGIVTVKEGLQGFANEGVLTVMVRKTKTRCLSAPLPPSRLLLTQTSSVSFLFFLVLFRRCLSWHTV